MRTLEYIKAEKTSNTASKINFLKKTNSFSPLIIHLKFVAGNNEALTKITKDGQESLGKAFAFEHGYPSPPFMPPPHSFLPKE